MMFMFIVVIRPSPFSHSTSEVEWENDWDEWQQ